jgi:flagellar biosynthetic protein FlhB
MAEQGQEQSKTEEPTPFKLRKAREKGTLARGTDLGYFGVLAALAAFLIMAGDTLGANLAQITRRTLTTGIAGVSGQTGPQQGAAVLASVYWSALQPVLLLGGTVVLVVLLLEIIQLRGFMFTSHPLKPDFSRLNPAKGLKRIFSIRMLKEAFKNILKFAAYTGVSALAISAAMEAPERAVTDAQGLATAMQSRSMKLLFMFIGTALLFVVIDQVIVRREFHKQMRMSRRELTREMKEHEGEPRLKQKRKQLQAEFAKQSQGLANLTGSDLLVVNPQHYAVALRYDPETMAAPSVTAKGRDNHALRLKRQAFLLGIPTYENRPLARGLYEDSDPGRSIGERHYRAVADLYLKLHQSRLASQ